MFINELKTEFDKIWSKCGLTPDLFWHKFDHLRKMLSDYMFNKVQIIEDDPDHQNGACVTLTAQLEGSDMRVLKY